ncbi:opacity-associated protein OapB [Bisgaard Taxon 10/6]|uniref:opacity-associated protein OapB n=1 Tax=Exercitatus varius TaxID=67857 RepID=UPI00294B6A37|nr:opacity-associated protein OapB [Exercitatus varius]MDG2959276.1 opacity-associated protein OapB [Exercitatus varius]
MKTTALFLFTLLLAGCSHNILPQPVESKPKPQTAVLDKTKQTGAAIRYVCKDDKEVRVVREKVLNRKSAKNMEAIYLTFGQSTEKLKSTVSESGKVYTNIHLRWIERVGGANTLTNSVGVVLADVCVAQ